ncbi:MAG TPA: hypothetical protein DDY68_02165 [Porphyromonadaceae bacterium]|nr:hypothetical protein [Porphyromonadaceae bacterium]
MEEIAFSFPYNLISSVEYLAKKHSITIKERKMEEECRFSFSIPLDKLHIFIGECKSLGCREIEKKEED